MNDMISLLGLARPEAQRMAEEAGVTGECPGGMKEPDLFRDAWSDLYGEEEPLYLLDREQRMTLKLRTTRMLGRRRTR